MSARQAADALGWTVNLASAQLDRLVQSGVAEKVKAGSGKRMAFQVAERFFNIWYLMRASRRVRRKLMWLVEFLRVFFSSEELQRLAHDSLQAPSADARSAAYMLALCRAIGPMPVVRALETRALEAVLSTRGAVLDEIFDMSGDDSDLASKAERIKARKAARAILEKMFAGEHDKGVIEQILGLPLPLEILQKLVDAFAGALSTDREELQQLVEELAQESTLLFGSLGYSRLSSAIANGDMENPRDVEGGEAAALRYGCPLLGIVPRLLIHPKSAQEGAELERLAREAIGFDSSGALYWICLAEALIKQDRLDDALDAARKVMEIAPDDPELWHRVGAVLANSPEARAEAEAAYRKVLAVDPDHRKGLWSLSALLVLDESSRPEAAFFARKLCALEPNDAENWLLLGLSLSDQEGAEEECAAAFKRATVLAPEQVDMLAMAAVGLFNIKRLEEAEIATRNLFSLLAARDQLQDEDAGILIKVLDIGCWRGEAPVLLRELDATEAAQRFRPAREALAAVVAGSSEVLNGVAPEVRKPALEILAIIAPELMNSEMLAAPI
jgi:Flp pilus assembly protein TadD